MQVNDAAIHCMQWTRLDKCGSLTGPQWIATGFQPSRWQGGKKWRVLSTLRNCRFYK